MNKCTLIIDGNWLLMSRLGLYMDRFKKSNPDEDKEQAKLQFIDFLAKSINVAINKFPSVVDNILMVQDGGSWRKSLPKPKLYQDESYKGTRKRDTDIDWQYVFGALDVLCKNFKDNDVTCICEYGVEGDDWAWYWSRLLNRQGTNCIIWTSDCDLKQLVQRDEETMRWTAWFNDKAGLVLPECYDDSNTDVMDLFMFGAQDDPWLMKLLNDTQGNYQITYINPYDIINEKIVCGDASDNIKSLVRVKKGTKTSRVTVKDWEKVSEGIETEQDLEDRLDEVLGNILSMSKFKGCTDSLDDIKEMFSFNKQLVWLDKSTMPKPIIKVLNSHKDDYKVCDIDYLKNNYKVLSSMKEEDEQDIENFLEGMV